MHMIRAVASDMHMIRTVASDPINCLLLSQSYSRLLQKSRLDTIKYKNVTCFLPQ